VNGAFRTEDPVSVAATAMKSSACFRAPAACRAVRIALLSFGLSRHETHRAMQIRRHARTSALRQIPCACGYDLRVRHVGDICPECGWVIDAAGSRWCAADMLHRLARMSRLGWIPCVMLLAAPALLVLGFATYETGSNGRIWRATIGAFCVLMPLQIITQAVAACRMSACDLDRRRAVRLRFAALVRVAAFVLAVLAIATEAQGVRWS
jgi:hypothetical protein